MALGRLQSSAAPGGCGTFDHIDELSDVRHGLAIREEWKSDVARVVSYQVVKPLSARVGPVGPQLDPASCQLLMGRFSQIELIVPRHEIMSHLRIIEEQPIGNTPPET